MMFQLSRSHCPLYMFSTLNLFKVHFKYTTLDRIDIVIKHQHSQSTIVIAARGSGQNGNARP